MADPARVMAVGTVMVDVLAVELPGVADPGHVVYAPRDIESLIGGHPIDVAIDMAEMGHPSQAIGLVAAIGEGIHGSYVSEVIDRYRLSTYLQRVPDHDTGTNLVLEVVGEDRRFHIDPGANWYLSPNHVREAVKDFSPHVLTIRPGYSGIDLHLAELLGGFDDVLVLLDVMQPHPIRPPDLIGPALGSVDMVHCNEREAISATGASTVSEAIDGFLDAGVQAVFVTSGESGARAITPDYDVRQSGFAVDAVDATGCGDAFCAGLILGLIGIDPTPNRSTIERLDPPDLAGVLAQAQAVGASAATMPGCVEGVTRAAVDEIWSTQCEEVLATTNTSMR